MTSLIEQQNNLPFDGMMKVKVFVVKSQYQHERALIRWPMGKRRRLDDIRDAKPNSLLLFDHHLNRCEIFELLEKAIS